MVLLIGVRVSVVAMSQSCRIRVIIEFRLRLKAALTPAVS